MLRILLADDHKIIRDGLRSLLDKVPDIEVVGEAENGRAAMAMCREVSPDIVVMDIGMKELNGIDATRQIIAECPGVRVIALSMHSDRQYVAEMLRAGASGYLVKDSAFDDLVDAVRAVSAGRIYLARDVTGVVVGDYVKHLTGTAPMPREGSGRALSPREREVLQLTAEGKSTKEIAAALTLSVKTVETHRRQIMEKLGIYNLAGLIKYAMRQGLASLD
jgi:DNA-binding NarL/FixJ family response regulator